MPVPSQRLSAALALAASLGCARAATVPPATTPATAGPVAPATARAVAADSVAPTAPPPPPARLLPLIGEYGESDSSAYVVFEQGGHLAARALRGGAEMALGEGSAGFTAHDGAMRVSFARDATGRVTALVAGPMTLPRRSVGPESGNQLLVTPVRPIAELRREALAASPPAESGSFVPSDLVELVRLDPTVKLEVRYATSNNLFGTPFYTAGRAFLQRPAAEALVRANQALHRRGFGLLVHDGYRPWYVTKMFWEAAPLDKRIFVADPAQGSRHNRGAAVDLTLYDLATGRPVEMPSTYDETTTRAAARYPGGTSLQRWHRDVLRQAMEAERFRVNPTEWWHFDFADWRRYPIGNVDFGAIPAR